MLSIALFTNRRFKDGENPCFNKCVKHEKNQKAEKLCCTILCGDYFHDLVKNTNLQTSDELLQKEKKDINSLLLISLHSNPSSDEIL
jgi:hypothetical protein